jgi:O-antigen/teichoic acid export membrane protein
MILTTRPSRISTSLNVHSVFSRWASSFATITINAAMQAVGLLIFARSLGPSEYAIIVAATAVSAVAAEFVGFGAGDLLIREVSRNESTHRSAFGRALRLVAISFVPASLGAALVAAAWFRTDATFAVLLVLVGSEIATSRLVFMTEQIAIAHHKTHAANANRIFATVVRFAIICVAVLVARVTTAADWAPFAALSAAICAFGCLVITARRFGAPDLRASFGRDFHMGMMFTLMQVVRAVQFSMDKFAVGWIAPGSIVGTFGVASRISQLGMLPAVAVTRITYPMFFAEGAKGLPMALRLARRIGPPIFGIALISTIALVLVAFVLPYLLGPAYTPAKPFLLMIALLPLAAGLQNLGGDVLSGADFQRQRVIAAVIGLACTVASIIMGTILDGVTGAILGYVVGQFLVAASLAIMAFSLNRETRVSAQP